MSFRRSRGMAVVAILAVCGCVEAHRQDGSLEVFVVGADDAPSDTLRLTVKREGDEVASSAVDSSSFSGSFRYDSAPAGSWIVKVTAASNGAVVLEAPSRQVNIVEDVTVGIWVRLNTNPSADTDGDGIRNGEDGCPATADAGQGDGDGDGAGDACDNCVGVPNPSQGDADIDGTGDACESAMTYAAVSDVFTSRCALSGCHAGSLPKEGLSLTASEGYANTVNVPSTQQPAVDRVEPSSLASSYLYRKIIADPSITGGSMPPLLPLPANERDLVRSWIEGGALP